MSWLTTPRRVAVIAISAAAIGGAVGWPAQAEEGYDTASSTCAYRDTPAALEPDALPHVMLAVLCVTNEQRARAGVAPVVADARLDAAAQAHAQDMLTRGFFRARHAGGL